METYDYLAAVCDDVREEIKNEYSDRFSEFSDLDELKEKLNEDLWLSDGVTGNGSGSYTFNTWQAEENLCHNFDLLSEAADEFGGDVGEWVKCGAEYCDVSIRCYLLSQAIAEVLPEFEEDFKKAHEESEDL